jgi:hypothetical protein
LATKKLAQSTILRGGAVFNDTANHSGGGPVRVSLDNLAAPIWGDAAMVFGDGDNLTGGAAQGGGTKLEDRGPGNVLEPGVGIAAGNVRGKAARMAGGDQQLDT